MRKRQPAGWSGDIFYQDPYRRRIFGRTPDALRLALRLIDDAMDASIRKADVFFFTLGLTEVFRNTRSGKIACQIPGHGGGAGELETEFYQSTFEENLENMTRVVEMIQTINPNAQIVLTVSPVRMSRTWTNYDVAVANNEMKSILRVVSGELTRKYDNVTYFPSYELVMENYPVSFREDDSLHIANWIVYKIVTMFKAAHLRKSTALAAE